MYILPFLKYSLLLMKRNWVTFVVGFIVMPIVLSLIYANLNGGTITLDEIKVKFNTNQNDTLIQYLENIGSNEDSFFEIVNTDFDYLSNYTEFYGSTDPLINDTDSDGLLDGLEVNLYLTNPTNNDTDGDGYEDGWEILNGYDPLDPEDPPQIDADVTTPEGDDDDSVSVSGSSKDETIPLGNFYLIFLLIGIICLTIFIKRDIICRKKI